MAGHHPNGWRARVPPRWAPTVAATARDDHPHGWVDPATPAARL